MAPFKRTEEDTYRVGSVTLEDISFIGVLLTVLYTAGAIFLACFSYQVGEPLSFVSMLLLVAGVSFCIMNIVKSARDSARGTRNFAEYVFLEDHLYIGYSREAKWPASGWRRLGFEIPYANTTTFKYDPADGITICGNLICMRWRSSGRDGQKGKPEHGSPCSTLVMSVPIGFPGELAEAICADGRFSTNACTAATAGS